jgi:dTDP-4-amino-4,6-dideoxygalactose transaminase
MLFSKLFSLLSATRAGKYNFVADGMSLHKLIKYFFIAATKRNVVSRFSEDLVRDSQKVIYTSSGRSALFLLLQSLVQRVENKNLKPNIVIPGFSCVVVCNAAKAAGLEVRFADIRRSDFCLDFDSVNALVDLNTVAIVVHHLFGYIEQDIAIYKQKWPKVVTIEDCAHSLGSRFKSGKPVGTQGDFSFFSFEQSKPITAWDGGALLVNKNYGNFHQLDLNEGLMTTETDWNVFLTSVFLVVYSTCYSRYFYLLGIPFVLMFKKLTRQQNSMNKKEISGDFDLSKHRLMSPFKVRMILAQLSKIEKRQAVRSQRVCMLADILGQFRSIPKSSYVLRFPLIVNDRSTVMEQCRLNGFIPGLWFKSPLHPVEVDNPNFPYIKGSCPNSEFISDRIINLPVSEKYSDQDILRVAYLVKRIIK